MSGGTAISSIIIDGYNLIGTQHGDLRKQREELIRQLIAYRKLKGHDITVVFDGWKSGGHKEDRSVTGGVQVIYSRLGDRADQVIKDLIGRQGKEWIVVTSDRDIADYAWSHGSVPVSSGLFLDRIMEKLSHAGSVSEQGRELPEEDDDRSGRKGNAHRPSKRAKAIARAVGRL